IFKKARQTSPTIVFFDEIDSIASNRNTESTSKVTEQVVNQLLTEMDGLEDLTDVVVVAATNRPDMIDSALLRPGRFDRILLAPVPDEESREKIFEVHTKGMPLAEDVNVKEMARTSDGYVGADIEAICREAAILALRKNIKAKKVNKNNFDDAMQKVHPSVNKDIKEAYENLSKQFTMKKGKELQEQSASYFG
ncbi:AAA family ATPase, partial [Candidatus Woesearchaeota archaeon]|nr:AAA family ATPase [Candidatus Woesearchaeota archaeon]